MQANCKMTTTSLPAIALGAFAMMGIATALAQDTVRVRGTIERIDGPFYVIKARDGAEVKAKLADNALVLAVVKASYSDIKQGRVRRSSSTRPPSRPTVPWPSRASMSAGISRRRCDRRARAPRARARRPCRRRGINVSRPCPPPAAS
jgi:hypothetical protein